LYADPPNSTTDQGSNTLCGITTPSSINFGTQGNGTTSAGQTVTFYSTNTGNLSISSIALATGTQFSIASNSCGATLNSGSNCSIVVKFAPTGLGPQTDTLKITDNTPGVTSPQLVPLAGIGVTPTQATAPSCSPTPGTYTGTQSATLTNSNSGTTVACYTTNGSTPATAGDGVTCTTGTAYSGAISVLFTQTIKAIAGTSTLPDSSVTSCAYTINAFPPAASIGMFALLQ
jgi:Fn3 associated